jgi:PAS domain S-box-containing protein
MNVELLMKDSKYSKFNAFFIALLYFSIGILWIYFSDVMALKIATSDSELNILQTYKGFFYIISTAILLYILVSRLLNAQAKEYTSHLQTFKLKSKLENSLQKTDALLKTIIDSTPDAIFVKDTEGKYLLFNHGAAKMTGKSEEEVLGNTDEAIFNSEGAKLLREIDLNILKKQIIKTEEECTTTLLGESKVFLATKGPIFKDDGLLLGVFGISRDITQQKKLENQLLKAQEIGHFGSYEFDIKNNFWASSKELNNILGLDENYQKTSQSWLDIVHKDFIDEMTQYLHINILTNKENFDKVYKIKHQVTGEDRWVYGQGTLELDIDTNPLKLIGVIQDITAQKEYELLIIEKKEEFETIFETTKDGIAVMDLDSSFLKVNEAYTEITGLSRKELFQTSCLALTIPEDTEKLKQIFKDVVRDGHINDLEKRCIINGKKITVSMSLSLMPDNKHILVSIKNISHKKLFEEQSKLAVMGEMIGNITHQWRQPLSVISTIASGISFRDEIGSLNDYKNISNDMKEITSQVNHLSQTIEDFRNFIRGDILAQEVNAKRLIEKTISIVHATMKKNDISLIVNSEDDFTLVGFENQLTQAFINIINNAKDALLENLSVEDDKYIFINISNNVERYIEFLDNGGGIPKEAISRIFEPYFTTKAQDIGTGIGLSMTHQIITQHHNAKIEAFNKEYEYNGKQYKGASFKIIFL